jgi:hypothetical protein
MTMDALQQFLSAYRSLCPGAGVVILARPGDMIIDITVATERDVRVVAERMSADVTPAPDRSGGTWYVATRREPGLQATVSALVQASKEVA